MKKIAAAALALTMVASMAVPASAVTTGKWNWGAIYGSINDAIVKDQTESKHTVSYDFNGGYIMDFSSGFSRKTALEFEEKGVHTVVDEVPTRFGYKFAGWELEGETYQAGDTFSLDGDVTLKAVWKR